MSDQKFGHFDADTFRAAHEEPTLVVGGKLYVGQLLGIEEWLGYAGELNRLRANAETSQAAYLRFYRRYLRAVFPRAWWNVWAPDPVYALLRLPWAVVAEALDRFFILQAHASTPSPGRSETASLETPTDGTDSPAKTPPVPPASESDS